MPELSARSVHVTDQLLAVLASEYPLPVSTRTIEERTAYGPRYGQLTYRMLTRLARRGEAEKMTVPDMRCRYWRLAAAPQAVPEPDADDEVETEAGPQARPGYEGETPGSWSDRRRLAAAHAEDLRPGLLHPAGPRAPRPDLSNLSSLPSGMAGVSPIFQGGDLF